MKIILQVLSFNTLSKGLTALITILLIRYIPSDEYAQYIFILSIISIVTQGLLSGINRIYLLNIEQKLVIHNEKYLASSFFGFQIIVVLTIALLGIPLYIMFNMGYYYLLIMFGVLSIGFIEYSKTIYQKKLMFMKLSIIEISRNILFLVGIVIVIFLVSINLNAFYILLLQIAAFFLVGLFALKGLIHFEGIFRLKEVWKIIREVIKGKHKYILIYFFILAFFAQLDVFMLKKLSTDFQLASYGSSFRYYSLLLLALGSVHTVIIPMIQKANSLNEIRNIYIKQIRLSFLFVPLVMLIILLSYWFIPIIDSGKYPEAPLIFTILAISSIISFVLSPHSNLLQRFEYYDFLPISVSVAFCINILLNSFFIPAYGGVGAAAATLISYAVQNSLIFYKSLRIQ
ncbi:hypothetical protein DXT76_06750, partial [Halobacillus trueperi]